MLSNDDPKHYAPIPDVLARVAAGIPAGARVLEIGPGSVPFPRATHVVDKWPRGGLLDRFPAGNVVEWDVHRTPLPFPDKYFDFIYCRHVVEDLHYPPIIFEEMSRIGKAGFIETPSPMAEICRGIDGNSPPWRGYHHHNWFVWSWDGVLHIFKKLPRIEHIAFPNEDVLENNLRAMPWLWNSYYAWSGHIEYREVDHSIYCSPEVREVITNAVTQGMAGSQTALMAILAD